MAGLGLTTLRVMQSGSDLARTASHEQDPPSTIREFDKEIRVEKSEVMG
jgi:hypothetical protein